MTDLTSEKRETITTIQDNPEKCITQYIRQTCAQSYTMLAAATIQYFCELQRKGVEVEIRALKKKKSVEVDNIPAENVHAGKRAWLMFSNRSAIRSVCTTD